MYRTPTEASDLEWLKRNQVALAKRGLEAAPFTKLYGLLRSKRLVRIALHNVLENVGAKTAGVDGISKKDLETDTAQNRMIIEITSDLRSKTYTPKPVRRVYIPKPNGKLRPLGIPTIKDRVVQEMLRLILEPIYEGKFYQHSYGFRPLRSTHHAVARLWALHAKHGYEWVMEGDIKACFDEIDHTRLVRLLRRTIKDERVIRLIQDILRAGHLENGRVNRPTKGTPQGGVISPLLANIFLDELDRYIARQYGDVNPYLRKKNRATPMFIVRYADDFVITVKSQADAERTKDMTARFLSDLGLTLSQEKSKVTHIREGYDFLGFNLRRYKEVVLITPSRTAVQRFRQKVKDRVRLAFHKYGFTPEAVNCINALLRGWAMYYRHISAARTFRSLEHYVWWTIWRQLLRVKGRKVRRREIYLQHYIPYSESSRPADRRYHGRGFGAWRDEQHETAILVINLKHIKIRYLPFIKPLHPYLPEELAQLKSLTRDLMVENDPTIQPPDLPSAYGSGWQAKRRSVLKRDHYRCVLCGNRHDLDVHHDGLKAGTDPDADNSDSLVTVCRRCHLRIQRLAAQALSD